MNIKKIFTVLLIIVLLVVAFIGGNSFGKYRSEDYKSLYANVAYWHITEDFLVNGRSSMSGNIELSDTCLPETLVNGRIAPGTSGTFGVRLDARGTETGVDYIIRIDNTSDLRLPKNVIFRCTSRNFVEPDGDLLSGLHGSIPANAPQEGKMVDIEIEWVWAYDSPDYYDSYLYDRQDTLDGENNGSFGFRFVIECVQAMPQTW